MANPYTWSVTGQTSQQDFDPTGNVVTGKLITFNVMPQNYTGSVFVPDVVYRDISAVQQIIQAEVDQIVAVHALTG